MAAADARDRTWVTYGLIAANLFAFAMELAAGASPIKPTAQVMIDLGANFPPRTLHGEPWRLFSSMFLHYGLLHIALNLVCLWQGRVVEQLYGRAGFVTIYLGSGLLGGVASMAFSTNGAAAGASGAVFGVYGGFGAFLALRRATMADAVWRNTTRQIAMFVVMNVLIGLSIPGISMSSHLGGLAAGFAIGAGLLAGPAAARQRMLRAAGLAVVALALTTAALFVIRAPADLQPTLDELNRIEATYQALAVRADAGTITEAQLAEEVERDVLAPWRSMRARVAAIDGPREGFEEIARYAMVRQTVWEALVAMVRATGDDKARLSEDFKQKVEASEQARDQLQRSLR